MHHSQKRYSKPRTAHRPPVCEQYNSLLEVGQELADKVEAPIVHLPHSFASVHEKLSPPRADSVVFAVPPRREEQAGHFQMPVSQVKQLVSLLLYQARLLVWDVKRPCTASEHRQGKGEVENAQRLQAIA